MFAALHALAQRRDQVRGQAVLRLVALHVEQAHARQHRVLDGAFAQLELAVAARPGVVPAFQRRRGRSEHDRYAQLARAPYRQVARRVAQAFLLLVRGIVLLVDDDHLQVRQRGEDRQAGAEDDARAALVRGQPVQHALAFGQAAVQRRQHHAGEARADIPFQLGGQVDFGDQDQDLRVGFALQHLRTSLQVHLGLAAAGDAVQQDRREAGGAADGVGRFLLRGVQHRHRNRRGVVQRIVLVHLLQRAVQVDRGRHAQVLRQPWQGDLAQRTLVIVGGEGGQRQPLGGQGRQLAAHGKRILQLFRGYVGIVPDPDDEPDYFARAETDQRQLADRRLGPGLARPAVIEAAVEGGVEGDPEDAEAHQVGVRQGYPPRADRKHAFAGDACALHEVVDNFVNKLWIQGKKFVLCTRHARLRKKSNKFFRLNSITCELYLYTVVFVALSADCA